MGLRFELHCNMISLFLTLAMANAAPKCFSLSEVRGSICWALCRSDGSDTGSYDESAHSCICGTKRDFREITAQAIKILPARVESTPQDSSTGNKEESRPRGFFDD